MAKKKTSTSTTPTGTGSKWFLSVKVGKYEPGIYYTSEVQKMPRNVKQHIQSLSSALRDGLIDADISSADTLNDAKFYSPVDKKTGEQPKLKGTKEGIFGEPKLSPSDKKIDNKLRKKLRTAKKKSQEESIKAKIAAKKAANSPQVHPSDAGH